MKIKPSLLTITLLSFISLLLLSSFASANNSHKACDNLSVSVGTSQDNELQLQARLDEVKKQLRHLRLTHGRGSHLSRTHKLREQLDGLQVAMQSLRDKQYLAGCAHTRQQASESARLTKLEQTGSK
jgi:hypothetical protein